MKMPLSSPVNRLRIDANDGPSLQLATVLSTTENVYSSLAWLPPEELAENEKTPYTVLLVLTLGVIPVLYSRLFRVSFKEFAY